MKHAAIKTGEDTVQDLRRAPTSARVPYLTAAAFCLTSVTRDAIQRASADRRLIRVKTEVIDGGMDRVRRTFEKRRTPSLLIIEVSATGEELLNQLDDLATICEPETKVVVIGTQNDISLYRTLMERGIAEYLVGEIAPMTYVATVQMLFATGTAERFGKVYAFVAAKGGVGASTLAQNVAWTMAEEHASPTLLLDLDFKFGSAAVNLDIKTVTGLEKYIADPAKLDAALLDRLIVKRGEYLSVLPGFADALGDVEPAPDAIDRLIEITRTSFPHVVVDLPHDWSAFSRDALTSADEVVVVASPDLANLQNTRAIMARLRAMRPNDAPPRVILNACRVPKRREITADVFAKSIGVEKCVTIAFDPATFGTAAAEGRAIREQAPRSKAQASVRHLARDLMGKGGRRGRGWLGRLFHPG